MHEFAFLELNPIACNLMPAIRPEAVFTISVESSQSASIGLNVKTPFFVGGVDVEYTVPGSLDGLPGFSGCVSQVGIS